MYQIKRVFLPLNEGDPHRYYWRVRDNGLSIYYLQTFERAIQAMATHSSRYITPKSTESEESMNYWADTTETPRTLPITEREAWHRDAWDREQDELLRMSHSQAGYDSPSATRAFGYSSGAVVHEL